MAIKQTVLLVAVVLNPFKNGLFTFVWFVFNS